MKMKSVILPLKHLNDGKYGQIPEKENDGILHLSDPMVHSFNYALGDGLLEAVKNIPPMEFETPSGHHVSVSLVNVSVSSPQMAPDADGVLNPKIFPRQCIESGTSYKSLVAATLGWMVNNKRMPYIEQPLGHLPIMVKSDLCNLHGLKPAELIEHGEDINNPGGYFIINGSKKILRLLTAQRRNYPLALCRDTWRHKQQHLSEKGLLMQCVAKDETVVTNVLHYLNTGHARLEFFINRRPYLVDLVMVLKALRDVNDREIVALFVAMRGQDTFFIEKVKQMLSELADRGLFTSVQCRNFIGRTFRPTLRDLVPPQLTDADVCDFMMKRFVFIHLNDSNAKFDLLCFLACKLYAFVAGDISAESLDVTSMMETSLSGFLYLKYLKEKLQDLLVSLKWQTVVKLRGEMIDYNLTEADLRKLCSRARKIGPDIESLITSGNLSSKSGLGLMQNTGLSIIMDNLNRMRDLSHLRAIHRGRYFLEMKTVAPRRLTGEAWGFICPVHTPDGAPCGLLNHLAYNCTVPAHPLRHGDDLNVTLFQMGMTMMNVAAARCQLHCMCPVLVDGRLSGYLEWKEANGVVETLRKMKTAKEIYQYTELVLIPRRPVGTAGGQYPGLYIFTTPARMMRPVVNLAARSVEFVGTFEQMYLNVAVSADQIQAGVHTHVDIDKTQIFSNIGKLVPFSDCNPNPRNMYQCQMGKQTMGTPVHNWRAQTNTKLYRLLYPQVPLVRNAHYDAISLYDHCMGFNAVLAIVSYTGYDIEDAMTVNKSSMERGLAHGQIYKTEFVDLRQIKRGNVGGEIIHIFSRDPLKPELQNFLDEMGVPIPGTRLQTGDPYYCTQDIRSRVFALHRYRGEACVVDKVALVETTSKDKEAQKISITIRAQRNPTIGDKFASRSGQKGIMSRLYPTEDLPFSERGIMPDIIFNPHGIPSRMTAGKLLELIAGKAAAEYALSFDSTPFEFNDENPAADYFGSILEKAGFNYYGEDTMYSGIDGRMLEVKVYQGIMYYQRLRHMTEDKYQVRSTGPVDVVTRQPIKGRQRGGAIRFGEMERDALIAHGAAFTLKDRLLDCSDASKEWVCTVCGCMLSPQPMHRKGLHTPFKVPVCSLCGPDAKMARLEIPHAFKYMVAELASLGIATKLSISDRTEDC